MICVWGLPRSAGIHGVTQGAEDQTGGSAAARQGPFQGCSAGQSLACSPAPALQPCPTASPPGSRADKGQGRLRGVPARPYSWQETPKVLCPVVHLGEPA